MILKNELTNDPLARGYSGMTDEQVVVSLNTKNRTRNRTSMTASEVFNAVNVAEYTALTAANKTLIWDVIHLGEINPFGLERDIFVNVFGAGSATIASLAAKRVTSISRAEELGIVGVKVGHVQAARSA